MTARLWDGSLRSRRACHSNVADLFNEDERRLPAEDRLIVVHGLIGAYSNALFEVGMDELSEFVSALGDSSGASATGCEMITSSAHRSLMLCSTTHD